MATIQPDADGERPRLIHAGDWTDEAGVRWKLRGQQLEPKQARRLMSLPGLRVIVVDGPRPREVEGAKLDELFARIHEFFAGEAPPMTDFRLAEFRSADRTWLLVVEESC